MKKPIIGASAVLIIFLIISCSQSQQAPPPKNDMQSPGAGNVAVTIKDFKFAPAEVNIKAGETVVWTNEDSVPHTVESSDKTLKSDELSKGDTYSYTFAKAGKYDYKCGIHPSMHGSVTVQ